MTLCIAALCQDNSDPMVVLCFDSRLETPIVSSDTEMKFWHLSEDDPYEWVALLSGNDMSQAHELCCVYGEFINHNRDKLTDNNLEISLRKPADTMRARLADIYTQQQAAISYDYFLKNGKALLPEFTHQEMLSQIGRQYIKADIIIIGWLEKERSFALVTYQGYEHRVAREHDFAVVGSGSTLASASLYQREQESSDSLERAVYAVYEAQVNGELAPGVGPYFRLATFRRESGVTKCQWLTKRGYNKLGTLYESLKQRPIPKIKISPVHFSEELEA